MCAPCGPTNQWQAEERESGATTATTPEGSCGSLQVPTPLTFSPWLVEFVLTSCVSNWISVLSCSSFGSKPPVRGDTEWVAAGRRSCRFSSLQLGFLLRITSEGKEIKQEKRSEGGWRGALIQNVFTLFSQGTVLSSHQNEGLIIGKNFRTTWKRGSKHECMQRRGVEADNRITRKRPKLAETATSLQPSSNYPNGTQTVQIHQPARLQSANKQTMSSRF